MADRRNVYLYYNHNPELDAKVDSLSSIAVKNGFHIVKDIHQASIIVSIGGDGTFLQAVRKAGFREDCLYAGIAVEGTVSLYCDFNLQDTDQMIQAMTEEQIEVRRYPLIDVKVDDTARFKSLNECSIRSGIIKTLVMDVYIDDLHFETFRGDGMIIATPTGSTAYNKSVSGAVVDPLLPCLQVSELASLNNNLYRTLGSSFLLGGSRKLTLKILEGGNDYPVIGMDNEALSIRHVKQIEISLADTALKTVKLKNNSFWEKVKRTFL
ncbi:NAD kinase [Metabacillus sp. GX 13764]|uniref:NAD kinase n=1 Tax=Metabacillus kandeliae TaxID=2900151 RepID=UPI001E46B152|nr:NAD kinase [Metabacillus kandeliae]MCD7032759.1 NAD kinase [Metabacillus kandeliae]